MNIDTTIVDAYLNFEDVSIFSDNWFFVDRMEDGVDNVFNMPPDVETKREVVLRIKDEIIAHASKFVPCNVHIWDVLVDDWRKKLQETTLDLIVGLPEPNDAGVRQAPDGKFHMIFDLLCWEKYLGIMPLAELSQNLLTHELFHVMVGERFPDIESAEMYGGYEEQLDAITFNEGFAHFVSYNGQEIEQVKWDGEQLTATYKTSASKMIDALREESHKKRQEYIYEANFGNYYDKYAAMCGMIYLGRQWQSGGAERLKEIFHQGWRGFATKSIVG